LAGGSGSQTLTSIVLCDEQLNEIEAVVEQREQMEEIILIEVDDVYPVEREDLVV
jgi:hypothetical protein